MGNPNSPDDPVLSAFMIVGAIATIAVCWCSLILGAVRKTESTEVFEQGLKRQVGRLPASRFGKRLRISLVNVEAFETEHRIPREVVP
jgi:hypothetical protein